MSARRKIRQSGVVETVTIRKIETQIGEIEIETEITDGTRMIEIEGERTARRSIIAGRRRSGDENESVRTVSVIANGRDATKVIMTDAEIVIEIIDVKITYQMTCEV